MVAGGVRFDADRRRPARLAGAGRAVRGRAGGARSGSAPRSRGGLRSQSACRCWRSWHSPRWWASRSASRCCWPRFRCCSSRTRRAPGSRGSRVLRNRSTSPWVALLAGWGILRVLALIPVAGALVGLVAMVVGLGALAGAMAGRQARRARGEARGAASESSRTRRLTVADSTSRGVGDATAVRVRASRFCKSCPKQESARARSALSDVVQARSERQRRRRYRFGPSPITRLRRRQHDPLR